ncbi:hypothetical protein ACEWY4_007737 [Coilia grayii]|uniref:Uncharacterized protein n=1 Tax=Coilia grayii TaxID=363190 RepID=A0ABD1K927_9TELE
MAASMVTSSSSDSDENGQKSHQKSKSLQRKWCYMHITSIRHEEMQDFTRTRWNSYRDSLRRWLELKGECRDVAENYKHCVDLEFESIPEDAAFHPTSYCRFIDKTAMAKMERRIFLFPKGHLQKAAELKDDHSILMHIKDKDCVAIEVQYHKSCYQQYTKFLSKPARPEKEQNEPMFDVSYNLFCERIIRQRLLVNQEVLKMDQLRKTFIELVKSSEGLDASNYRQDTLKKRLTCDFPQLVFHTPAKRNICELVFAETVDGNTCGHATFSIRSRNHTV